MGRDDFRRSLRPPLASVSARHSSIRMGCRFEFVLVGLVSALLLLNYCDARHLTLDAEGLFAFKEAADPNGILNQSWFGDDPCSNGSISKWKGIQCNRRFRVSKITLNNLALNGTFAENTLSKLNELQTLVLSFNSLKGAIPDLSNCTGLAQLWLQNNQFSGPAPKFLSTARRLSKLDLSVNKLSGQIPDLNASSSLLLLHLENNSFTGRIPLITSNVLGALNLSWNQLGGEIPASLSKFPSSSFAGNSELCGQPLSPACPSAAQAPDEISPIYNPSPSPSIEPVLESTKIKLSTVAVVAIVVGDTLVVMVVIFFFAYYWRRSPRYADEKKPTNRVVDGKLNGSRSSSHLSIQSLEDDSSNLIFFEDAPQRFYLEELLRASAEMLGKGSFGTAYKAVVESGVVVVVKRLRDVKDPGRKDFERHMELLGKLRHPNLVPLRAYYYAKEEKLLVYDYMTNHSLFTLLHGSRGPGRSALDWSSRVHIARGVAAGLAYIHKECDFEKVFHGNIKSTNILLGKNFEVCISDFGLVYLMSPAMATQRTAGYRAPEYSQTKSITQMADVYSFGVLLLELLTGRQPKQSLAHGEEGIDLPQWVQSVVREEWTAEVFDVELKSNRHIEEEMVTLLQIAMACVIADPEQRPKMAQLVDLMDEIRVGDSFPESEPYENYTDDFTGHDSPSNV